MTLNTNEHRQAAYTDIDAGEITLYRLNKVTYDVIERLRQTDQSVVVTRHGRPLAKIVPLDDETVEELSARWDAAVAKGAG